MVYQIKAIRLVTISTSNHHKFLTLLHLKMIGIRKCLNNTLTLWKGHLRETIPAVTALKSLSLGFYPVIAVIVTLTQW